MTTEIKIGAACAAHVEGVLLNDPVLKAKLGPKDVDILRRDGTATLKFHRLSVDVARRMMADNKYPLQSQPSEVKDCARLIVDEQAQDEVVSEVREVAAVQPTPVAPATAAPVQAAVKPTPVSAPAPAPVSEQPVTPEPVATDETPVKKTRKKRTVAGVEGEAPATNAEPAIESDAPVAERTSKRDPQVNIQLCIYSLLTSALELAERDRLPNAQDRKASLADVASQYRDVVDIKG